MKWQENFSTQKSTVEIGKRFKGCMCTVECYNWDVQKRNHRVAHLGPSKTLSLYSSLFWKTNRMLRIWGESKGKHRKHYCATSICCAYLMTAACYFLYLRKDSVELRMVKGRVNMVKDMDQALYENWLNNLMSSGWKNESWKKVLQEVCRNTVLERQIGIFLCWSSV